MKNKNRGWGLAYDVLVLLVVLAGLTFICRLWPILLLLILGIFAAAIWLLFQAVKEIRANRSLPAAVPVPARPSSCDPQELAYSHILNQITELVTADHPGATWIWETPAARKLLLQNGVRSILLNHAGGYRKAFVDIRDLQVQSIRYSVDPSSAPEDPPAFTEEPSEPEAEEDYDLMAFEWVDANIMELNDRCNEIIGQGLTDLDLKPQELPAAESWPAVCEELKRAELPHVAWDTDGIHIKLKSKQ